MHIHTIEEDYEYRMKNIMEDFLDEHEELKELDVDELQDKLWETEYAKEFGRAVMEDMMQFAGDELFMIEK